MKILEVITESKNIGAVNALKKDLLSAKKRGDKMDYDGVAKVMDKVWTKYTMTGKE